MAQNVALWVVSAVLAALYLAAGLRKVGGEEEIVQGFLEWGYGDAFRVFIGACEVAGGIGLLIPRLATWAASGLAIIMLGAIYTHVWYDVPGGAVPVVCVVLLALVAYGRRTRALWPAGGTEAADDPATP